MPMSAEEWKQRLADLERSGQPMSLQDEYEAARRLGGKRGSTLVLNSRHVTWQRRRLRTASFTGTASTAPLTLGRRFWRQCSASNTSTYRESEPGRAILGRSPKRASFKEPVSRAVTFREGRRRPRRTSHARPRSPDLAWLDLRAVVCLRLTAGCLREPVGLGRGVSGVRFGLGIGRLGGAVSLSQDLLRLLVQFGALAQRTQGLGACFL